MANYIAKSLVSKPLDAVKNVTKDVTTKQACDEELEAQLAAAEEKRREKFENMEEEREVLRQTIRDKYGIKKKDFLDVADINTRRRSSASSHRASDASLYASKRTPNEDPLPEFTKCNPQLTRQQSTTADQVKWSSVFIQCTDHHLMFSLTHFFCTVNLPPILRDAANKAASLPQKIISEANEKCELM
ncbi:hypothetical protein CRM22_011257 [Opisthorchis felineus]|uniref:Complexin n=1 Tax=Opisthorchis felineus TaxID=147828 RepID=A0A4S2JZN6_OPIFE|nr:hypothetical protein CRM22_011257 [Opisthorchis felineus]